MTLDTIKMLCGVKGCQIGNLMLLLCRRGSCGLEQCQGCLLEKGLEVDCPLTRTAFCPLQHNAFLLSAPLELLLTLQQKKRLLAKRNASSKNTTSRVGTVKEIILT